MIVTVRRWTSIALPRLSARSKTSQSKVTEQNQAPQEQNGFLDTYNRMFEHQVNLMFRDDLKN
jgi:hypothetical protein